MTAPTCPGLLGEYLNTKKHTVWQNIFNFTLDLINLVPTIDNIL